MAIPKPDPKDWQRANAQILQVTDREVLAMLRDAKKRVDEILRDLPDGGVQRAQLERTRAKLLAEQSGVFTRLGDIVSARRASAASRAARLSAAADASLLSLVGKGPQAQYLYDSALEVGQRAIDTALQRMKYSALPLSQRIYKSNVWMNGRLGKLINETLASGLNASDFAKRARDWFNPNTPGGIRYAAMRLARTEINNAFHSISAQKYAETPWITEVEWNLSGSHLKPDVCNEYAVASPYPSDEAPARPHPQCLCYITPKSIGEEEFIDNFLKGDYDEYLDAELEKNSWNESPQRAKAEPQPVAPAPKVATRAEPSGPLNVLDRLEATFSQPWQKQSEPLQRAAGLWAESFFGLEAVRNAMRNIRNGIDPLEGTDLRRGRLDVFRDHQNQDDESSPHLYSEEDFRNDVVSAANLWEQKLTGARANRKVLYRGLRMNPAEMYKVGDEFSQGVSSWTEDRSLSEFYANIEDESTGHIGSASVVVKLIGSKHSFNIDPHLGYAMKGSKEHIARGRYRVVKVTSKGSRYTVEVEEVSNE